MTSNISSNSPSTSYENAWAALQRKTAPQSESQTPAEHATDSGKGKEEAACNNQFFQEPSDRK